MSSADRRIAGDWHVGVVPANVRLDPEATVETSYSFQLFRSRREDAITVGRSQPRWTRNRRIVREAGSRRVSDASVTRSGSV